MLLPGALIHKFMMQKSRFILTKDRSILWRLRSNGLVIALRPERQWLTYPPMYVCTISHHVGHNDLTRPNCPNAV
jgi:hypothetical protein